MVSSICLVTSPRGSDVNYRVFKQEAMGLSLPVSLADVIPHRLNRFLHSNDISCLIVSF